MITQHNGRQLEFAVFMSPKSHVLDAIQAIYSFSLFLFHSFLFFYFFFFETPTRTANSIFCVSARKKMCWFKSIFSRLFLLSLYLLVQNRVFSTLYILNLCPLFNAHIISCIHFNCLLLIYTPSSNNPPPPNRLFAFTSVCSLFHSISKEN